MNKVLNLIPTGRYDEGDNPKEEPKQETLKEAAQRLYPVNNNTGSMYMPTRYEINNSYKQEGFINGAEWHAEKTSKLEETLEGDAERYERHRIVHDENYCTSNDIQDLKESYYYKGRRDECIKQQNKQKYSEEEVFDLLWKFRSELLPHGQIVDYQLREFFEKFKKK